MAAGEMTAGQDQVMDMLKTNRAVIEQFRAGGPIEGMHRERLLLLTTVGRRSGEPRTSPMMFHREGEHLYVVASNMGAPSDPAWCVNLRADPRVTVEVADDDDGRPYAASADPLEGPDRDELWARIVPLYPFFAAHEKAAAPRVIPVVELRRA